MTGPQIRVHFPSLCHFKFPKKIDLSGLEGFLMSDNCPLSNCQTGSVFPTSAPYPSTLSPHLSLKITIASRLPTSAPVSEVMTTSTSFYFFHVLFILCVGMYTCAYMFLRRPEGISSPGSKITGCWESNSGPLERQRAPLTAEPSASC